MKTIVLYYTLGGATKTEAERVAEQEGAALCQVTEEKKRNIISAFISGCPNAMKRKASKIRPLNHDLNEYDRIIIGCPIWAGYPAPAFNSVLELLPRGKEVGLFFCSGAGAEPKSERGTKDLIAQKGCTLIFYRDVKAVNPSKKTKGQK
ncbi:MAG: flavodoxin family protein [Oscillospiraceae bacterium]